MAQSFHGESSHKGDYVRMSYWYMYVRINRTEICVRIYIYVCAEACVPYDTCELPPSQNHCNTRWAGRETGLKATLYIHLPRLATARGPVCIGPWALRAMSRACVRAYAETIVVMTILCAGHDVAGAALNRDPIPSLARSCYVGHPGTN